MTNSLLSVPPALGLPSFILCAREIDYSTYFLRTGPFLTGLFAWASSSQGLSMLWRVTFLCMCITTFYSFSHRWTLAWLPLLDIVSNAASNMGGWYPLKHKVFNLDEVQFIFLYFLFCCLCQFSSKILTLALIRFLILLS